MSPANIVRLKEGWKEEYEAWSTSDLSGKRYVYLWADGIYFNVRLTKERPCMLLLIGRAPEGRAEKSWWDYSTMNARANFRGRNCFSA